MKYIEAPSDFADNTVIWYRMVGNDLGPQVGTGDTLRFSPATLTDGGDYKYTYDHTCAVGGPATSNWHIVSIGTKYSGPAPTLAQQGTQLATTQDFGTYVWYVDGIPVDTTDADFDNWNIFTPTIVGTYTVGAPLDLGACGDTFLLSNPIVFPFVSVDNEQLTALTISPNPAKDAVQISGLKAATRCRILNALGQEVYAAALQIDGLVEIPATVVSGLYTVQVEGYGSLRLVKE